MAYLLSSADEGSENTNVYSYFMKEMANVLPIHACLVAKGYQIIFLHGNRIFISVIII
jgi:hypothetical protein